MTKALAELWWEIGQNRRVVTEHGFLPCLYSCQVAKNHLPDNRWSDYIIRMCRVKARQEKSLVLVLPGIELVALRHTERAG